MKTKHTPGPWINKGEFIRSIDGVVIARAPIKGGPSGQYWPANAQLIEVAPDMLQALINVRERLLEVLVAAEHPEIFIEINDAIKKATP